jgi:aryl-alcohol dehydrogenase-like predicted oxidoreductase
MDTAVRERKTVLVGCSNFDANQLRSAVELAQARKLAQFEVTQPVYNLAHREIENDLLPLCERERIATIVYSPLGAGFLTGKYRADIPFPKGSRFDVIPDHAKDYFSEKNFRLIERLQALAERAGLSMARLAMSWVFSNPAIQSVLIGARTPEHIDNAVESLNGLSGILLDEISRWT